MPGKAAEKPVPVPRRRRGRELGGGEVEEGCTRTFGRKRTDGTPKEETKLGVV